MPRPVRASDASAAIGTLVVLAIGLRLMLAGAAAASSACSTSLDRTGVRRFSVSFAQAIREISERAPAAAREPAPEPDWADAPRAVLPVSADLPAPASRVCAGWTTALPPPSA